MKKSFYSNGKLLITGEYGVLDGALALAMPTSFGQSLRVEQTKANQLHWISKDERNAIWFEAIFNLDPIEPVKGSDSKTMTTLHRILVAVNEQNPILFAQSEGLEVETKLTFPKNWGLGSSSTLIANIAQWAAIDPYLLLGKTFRGSGYDIACASHDCPLHYRIENNSPEVTPIAFDPPFKDQLFFIYLNQKQNSREAIATYRKQEFDKKKLVSELSELTIFLTNTKSLYDFEKGLEQHEKLLSKVLKLPPVKERIFSDYQGAIKSLGGWGGDFILATGNEKTPDYFKVKGFNTVISYGDMAL